MIRLSECRKLIVSRKKGGIRGLLVQPSRRRVTFPDVAAPIIPTIGIEVFVLRCLPLRRNPGTKGSHPLRPSRTTRRVRVDYAREVTHGSFPSWSSSVSIRSLLSSRVFAQARSFLPLLFEVSPFGAVHETVNIVKYSRPARGSI